MEEVDFQQHGGFSPNGQTLLLYTNKFTDELNYNLWIRAVDPANSESRLILTDSANPFPVAWSPDSTKLVTSASEDITIYSIPDGSILKTWDTGRMATTPMAWSPDGQNLAVQGYALSGQEEALYIVQMSE